MNGQPSRTDERMDTCICSEKSKNSSAAVTFRQPASGATRSAIRGSYPTFAMAATPGREPSSESSNISAQPMIRILMSSAAAAMLRAILARAGVPRERILLTEIRSVDWHSLTMVGERHELSLRIPGPDAAEVAARLCDGLTEAEFAIPGQIVADICVADGPSSSSDGSVSLAIEALTIGACG